MIELDEKKRIIQEFVPGKQVTLCHVSARPEDTLYAKLGLIDAHGAIGIMTITPSEAAMIGADVAAKAASVEIGFVDRFNGSLVITGEVAAVEEALAGVMQVLCDMMGFSPAPMTRTEGNWTWKTGKRSGSCWSGDPRRARQRCASVSADAIWRITKHRPCRLSTRR